MRHLVVVGAGLSGLYSALCALDQGAAVTLISQGRGGLSHSHGCIDVWAGGAPTRALPQLRDDHPYSKLGISAVRRAIDHFLNLCSTLGSPYMGDLSQNLSLPTVIGRVHKTTFAPESMALGSLDDETPITLLDIPIFRDAPLRIAAEGLRAQGFQVAQVIPAPLANYTPKRDVYATDIARLFDSQDTLQDIARAWKPLLSTAERVGIPAVLGYDEPGRAYEYLSDAWSLPIFEIPTLPPSLTGLRLERLLRTQAVRSGVAYIEGARVIGRVDGQSGGRRVSGVVSVGAPASHIFDADALILATGGFLHGGLTADRSGRVHETVFDLPVVHTDGRQNWLGSGPFSPQPYATFGLSVDRYMRPLNAGGEVMYENLFAAGGVIAGADRSMEGCRQGLDLATAYRAVESALS